MVFGEARCLRGTALHSTRPQPLAPKIMNEIVPRLFLGVTGENPVNVDASAERVGILNTPICTLS